MSLKNGVKSKREEEGNEDSRKRVKLADVIVDSSLSLQEKIKAGLKHLEYIFVIGASNKIEDHDKTGRWSWKVKNRIPGCYSLISKGKWEMMYAKGPSKLHSIFPATPFGNNKFLLFRSDLSGVLKIAINSIKSRVGNCHAQCCVLAQYFWKKQFAEIHRIEIIATKEFDHVFLVINREINSDLLHPKTWGDAWIVDAWREKDLFYPASLFNEKMIDTLNFCKEQCVALRGVYSIDHLEKIYKKYEESFLRDPDSVLIPLKILADIFPNIHPYKNLLMGQDLELEDYFEETESISQNYEVMKKEKLNGHKKKFAACLAELQQHKKFRK